VLINIIPWNPVEGMDFQEPSEGEVKQFQQALEQRGISTSRRYRRGRGINGACGQLAVQDRA
jgi:23S rRNA (adenine2503-C2)-methyltransferase